MKGSTVGQLPIELQPPFCGGVGQIRPYNCLPSHTGTAASPHPLKPATEFCSFGEPSVRNKHAPQQQFYLCSGVDMNGFLTESLWAWCIM